jgi:hypothetical protein
MGVVGSIAALMGAQATQISDQRKGANGDLDLHWTAYCFNGKRTPAE